MIPFCDPALAKLLDLHKLNNFDALWNLSAQAVEEPNVRRGGWSGVWNLSLADGEGITHNYFLKRQQNHLARRQFPFTQRPTFYWEYRKILQCQALNLPTLDLAYYGERKQTSRKKARKTGDYHAILITPAIEKHIPFSNILPEWAKMPQTVRFQYLKQIALLAANLHKNRLSHNGLYPRHLFVNLEQNPPIKMIDMERIAYQWQPVRKSVAELVTIVRRAEVFSDLEVEYLLNQYWENHKIGLSFQALEKRFQARFKSKQTRKTKAA